MDENLHKEDSMVDPSEKGIPASKIETTTSRRPHEEEQAPIQKATSAVENSSASNDGLAPIKQFITPVADSIQPIEVAKEAVVVDHKSAEIRTPSDKPKDNEIPPQEGQAKIPSLDIHRLLKGIAIVIDDECDDRYANINGIINRIKDANIPIMTFNHLPSDELLEHFDNISFLILDWNLNKLGLGESARKRQAESENIEFIGKLFDVCFCPVFIFTNEPEAEQSRINELLVRAELIKPDKPNPIFIHSKTSLLNVEDKSKLLEYQQYKEKYQNIFKNLEEEQLEFLLSARKEIIESTFGDPTESEVKELILRDYNNLFKVIQEWMGNNPSMYVLKEWEREYQISKNRMFLDFHKLSPIWPRVMWENFEKDGVSKSFELGELISRNLSTRMRPFEFDATLLSGGAGGPTSEIRQVIEGALFLKKECLHENDIAPGDLFYNSGHYYTNIRAACDLIPTRNGAAEDEVDVILYLLEGSKLSGGQRLRSYSPEWGKFMDKENEITIFPLVGGKAIKFLFKDLYFYKWSEIKDQRIGRILPPYITKIQQYYSHYMHRQGMPRIPADAIND